LSDGAVRTPGKIKKKIEWKRVFYFAYRTNIMPKYIALIY